MRRPAAALLVAAALAAAGCRGRDEGPNVLLVTIETMRADHLGARRGAVELTPHLDRLAARGARFGRAYAASSFTLPSLVTLATGEPPPVHRVRFWTQFGNRWRGETTAERFRAAGFATGFVDSSYVDLGAYRPLERGWTERVRFVQRDADEPLAAASAFLDRHGAGRFFLWVHLFEPHTPYGPAERFVEGLAPVADYRAAGRAPFPVVDWVRKVGAGGPALADALHAADVRAADDAVGRLLADLDRRGLSGRTVVCVTSDHGENLSADPEPRWDHGISCDEQLVRVPLAFAGPGVAAGARDASLARHVDLPPTLLRLAGVEAPPQWRGRDLFGAGAAPAFAIAECTVSERKDAPMYTVTDGARSLRVWTAAAPARMELRDERDRGARPVPVDAASPPEAARPMLEAWRAESEAAARRAAEVNEPGEDHQGLTPEQEAILKMGGYIR